MPLFHISTHQADCHIWPPRYDKNVVKHVLASKPAAVEKTPQLEPWVGEPETIDKLVDAYNVEAKIPGRTPGTTLFVVSAIKRDGTIEASFNVQWGFFHFF